MDLKVEISEKHLGSGFVTYKFVAVLVTAFIGYLSSGALITNAMSTVGVSAWKFTLAIAVELAVGVALALYLPRMFKRR